MEETNIIKLEPCAFRGKTPLSLEREISNDLAAAIKDLIQRLREANPIQNS